MTPEEFVKKYLPDALRVEVQTGFHHLITLTQGALESGWGSKAIGNNFFGIKWIKGDRFNKQLITTTEYLSNPNAKFPEIISITKQPNGKYKYIVKDYFRLYDTTSQGFSDHISFFNVNPRYKNACLVKNEPEKFFDEITKAGYATAPDYANQLKQVMQSVIKRLPK